MPSYKLTYFDINGSRGDSIRMALHYGGIPFTDERLAPEWLTSDFKDSLPFGQVPILTIDENKVISQEGAIILYVGRLVGLYPDDREEAVKVDITSCFVEDLYRDVLAFFAPEHPGRDIITKMTIEERIPKTLGYLDKYLANHETTFSAGNSLTVADLRIFAVLRLLKSGMLQGLPTDLVDRYPQIAKLCKAIESHAKIASWLKVKSQ
ncbi:hypothetical protein MJO28_001261 [Puccinia striiformis f. sp. tritici]|uniref:Uncharacterized protein n=1 Tax=Puccinia striiformis f. sp. tritici TaxID=168172 RepID=A0ACC0ETG1_9BASI|nr:hypothetical protein Pst134EA_003485 [Puccinia striiformis f. sp. tritici]KAH9472886.1 hypothetical protein Pst134EA_003485 [Puccinia striiformis f. sp. tritici]KAI7960772.1 hypothetical protein MJO28_001261 [Puccinia striiformis f. sp. tritici]KAI9611692.1 hypothetical protein H4Q26_008647 [Puccinia striiformis f. sp. tritici PST-130]